MDCNYCVHNPVCALWRANECQDASCYAAGEEDECALYFPSADVVEVVRCKNCKHCDPENGHCDHTLSTSLPFSRKPDDYCSYGERWDAK